MLSAPEQAASAAVYRRWRDLGLSHTEAAEQSAAFERWFVRVGDHTAEPANYSLPDADLDATLSRISEVIG